MTDNLVDRLIYQGPDYVSTRTEVLRKKGENQWDPIWFNQIKAGDVVRLRDPGITWLADEEGQVEYIAKSDSYIDDSGKLCFDL